MKEEMRKMETGEMHFFRAVVGYKVTGHKHNEDIREELGIMDTNTVIKYYQKKRLKCFERMSEGDLSV
jgi:N-acetyl-gamma-glutamylphosphate reductase